MRSDSSLPGRNRTDLLFLPAFGFFLFMMLFHLMHSPLWGDEWVEYSVSQQSIQYSEMIISIIRSFQPPLYNFVMHFWLQINNSILWFRLFNVLVGFISGIIMFKTLSLTANRIVASATVFVLGATYQWVFCIQECSEYSLMVMFLFFALYYFILTHRENTLKNELLLILSCILAIYSQYGAVFVAVPLLMQNFFNVCRSRNLARIKTSISIYVVSVIVFAAPLYYFFARWQLMRNGLEHNLSFNYKEFSQFPVVFGKLYGYFFHVSESTCSILLAVSGFVFLCMAFILLFRKETDWNSKICPSWF
ncbi:MAG: glycosyltransferase family 39 protein [Oscillospiraceae bacterium]|nr:glycosyltransferase family 39 protein [Oscillospiraceae bacterium]